jgi:acyl transferase domain-containing protein/NAD(P)-dependent dehydrogenase (short-subunit alcohol dehydrogenase family)/acyl carrier protein/SAM-dependent methyltransferase
MIERATGASGAERFRVIEAGAGTGGLTRAVIECVGDLGGKLSYSFTDVSKGFLEAARLAFGPAVSFLEFKLLDLERDPEEQGFEPGEADVVLCSNVVHAARRVAPALRRLKRLLRPGGVILIHEAMKRQDFSTLTFGLTSGWWHFEDEPVRLPGSPLLGADTWKALCLENGFRHIRVLGLPGEEVAPCDEGLLVAESDGLISRETEPATKLAPSTLAQNGATATPSVGEAPAESWIRAARDYVRAALSVVMKLPGHAIEDNVNFDAYGVDSLIIMELRAHFERDLGHVPATLLFSKFTVAKLAGHFAAHYRDRLPGAGQRSPAPAESAGLALALANSAVKPGAAAVPSAAAPHPGREEDIAIIGLSGVYPGAADLDEFWKNLEAGKSSVTEIPASRWDWRDYYHPDPEQAGNGRSYCKWGAFLEDFDKFDPLFFGISPREAEVTDPQERLFLQTAWSAIEDAGYTPRGLRESADGAGGSVGVFVGVTKNSYQLNGPDQWARGNPVVANSLPWSIANRVSYALDFQGPSIPFDTACSSSLTALHAACESLRRGECAAALAGGVNLYLHPSTFVALCHMRMLSPDGVCRSYGSGANGFAPGEGVGAVLLKPLSRARADGDHIYGLVKSTAINHGGRTNGYTVPNPAAQAALIRKALDRAGVPARSIGYIEGHGTGTSLGDPIEIAGLTEAFRRETSDAGFCRVGSLKTNIGHMESAAGIGAVTKVLLQLKYRRLAPSLHAEDLNPHIDFEPGPFRIQRIAEDWRPLECVDGGKAKFFPRRAGVSSFGAGGANAHAIIEEAPEVVASARPGSNRARLIVLSARAEEQLKIYARRILGSLEERGHGLDLDSVAHTLQTGREEMDERLALIARTAAEACEKLREFLANGTGGAVLWRGRASRPTEAMKLLLEDDGGDALVRSMLEKGELDKCARLWVAGVPMDWLLLYPERRPARVSLPTYPFKKERYWIPERAGAASVPAPLSAPVSSGATGRRWTTLRPVWKPHPLENLAARVDRGAQMVVFASDEPRARQIKDSGLFASATWVRPAAAFGRPEKEVYGVRTNAAEDYRLLLRELGERRRGPVHFVSLLSPAEFGVSNAGLDSAINHYLTGPHYFLQALLPYISQLAPKWIVATPGDGDASNPWRGLVAGYLKGLRLEHPAIEARWISYDERAGASLGGIVAGEIQAGLFAGNEILYRNGERFVRDWERCEPSPEGAPALRPGGRYLVTGGAGGLGLLFAEHLLRTARARLILAGRSELAPDKQERLDRLASLGGEARYIRADVSNRSEALELVGRAQALFGGLDGVIHAAGVLDYGRLATREAGAMRRVLAPKVDGVVWLDEATRELELDFFALFSSLSAVIGVSEAADYAAGNAFLDHFAGWREGQRVSGRRKGKCVSINWPHWREGGMRFADPTVAQNWESWTRRTQGLEMLPTESGLAAFHDALRGADAQRCVIEGDPTKTAAMVRRAAGLAPLEAVAPVDWRDRLESDLVAMVSELLKVKPGEVSLDSNLSEFGFDSISLKALADRVNARFGLDLMPSIFFSHASLLAFKLHLASEHGAAIKRSYEAAGGARTARGPEPRGEPGVVAGATPVVAGGDREDVIAVVGMSGVFPGAPDLETFWRRLENGDDLISEVPAERWNWRETSKAGSEANKPSRWGGFIDDVDAFDAGFFGIHALEAERMDPQHRVFLQEAWRAIEAAGESPAALSGRRVGVFAGVQFRDYEGLLARRGISDAYTATGNGHAMLANRVSFALNLQGPSESVDTACSSSLVAINRAVAALQRGECVSAVAGAVSLLPSPDTSIGAGHLSVLSPDGRCKTFDASANGYVKGEGVGVLYLMRLKDALAGGYPVGGIIRGVAVNHGGRAQSLTAPNAQAQRDLLIESYSRAGVAPETVGMIEVHGTGTELGDPVEINGLKEAFAALGARFGSAVGGKATCGLGSVKSNIGHLEPAAGIAGVIKALLAIRHQKLPPTLHVKKLNPYIDLAGTPFYLLTSARRWEPARDADNRPLPRRAGVSSFGFGGANAHVILEEFPAGPPPLAAGGGRLVALSAKTGEALVKKVAELRAWLDCREGWDDLGALCHTLAVGRSHFKERVALVVESVSGLRQQLAVVERGEAGPNTWRGAAARVSDADRLAWESWQAARPVSLETLGEAARRYVDGFEIEWGRLFEPAASRRLELPGYPLKKDRYWIPGARPVDIQPGPSVAALPPVFEKSEATGPGRRYFKTLRPDDFCLEDHVVGGARTLPGAAYLEIARAAAAELNGAGEATVLRHVVWAQPIRTVNQPVVICLDVVRQGDQYAFEARTEPDGRSVLHSRGKIAFAAVTPVGPDLFNPAEFGEGCSLVLDRAEIYEAFRKVGLDYGPSFRALEWIKAGPEGALGRARLSERAAGAPGRNRFVLHPSLMDAAFQTVLGLDALEDRKEPALTVPFGIDEVVIHGSLPDVCLVLALSSRRNLQERSKKHDFRIFSESGRLVCSVRGFMVREMSPGRALSSRAAEETRYYFPTWAPAPALSPARRRSGGMLLVLDNDDGRFAAVRDLFMAGRPGAKVVQVMAGASFDARGDGSFVVRPEAVEDFVRLVESAFIGDEDECFALQLWPLGEPDNPGGIEWSEELLRDARAEFALAQALLRKGVKSVRLVHACRGNGAASAGFAKCLVQENSHYRFRVVEARETLGDGLVLGLVTELMADEAPVEIRWSGGQRLAKQLAPCVPATNGKRHARPPVYLITGGLGGLGRLVAEHLARSESARLVLAGRSAMSEGGREFLVKLGGLGGEGVFVQADVATMSGAERAARNALDRFGALDGVFHAAGIIRDAMILKKKPAHFDEVLRVKTLGAVYLDLATIALPLEHFVLFSSVASVLGNLGQGDYAAANGFLDDFARWREERRSAGERQGKTLSINWPLWREGGMSVDAQTEQWLNSRLGVRPLPASAGLAALGAAMASPHPQIVVLHGEGAKIDGVVLGGAVAPAKPPVPAVATAGRREMTVALTGIYAELLRVDPSDIEVDGSLDDYGVDSIMMITIMNELEKRLGRALPPSVLSDYPTVSSLAGYLVESGGVSPPATENEPVAAAFRERVSPSASRDRRIAIIGMSCRFPQSPSLEAYWQNLEEGRDLVREVPGWRWDPAMFFSEDKDAAFKSYAKRGGFVDGIDLFDAGYFGISDRDALGLDPQHRILLELAQELFDHAGYGRAGVAGKRAGVIIGAAEGKYLYSNLRHLAADQTGHMVVNTGQNMMAARIADFFNLKGAAKTVDTACSSSLMAVHDACQTLLAGDLEMAVAGGVHLLVDESAFVGFSKARVLSDDGRCYVFDERAKGFVLGEGAGLVLLKPYQDAVEDGDRILATILASAANNDGHTIGLTVPSLEGQREVIEEAVRKSGVDPSTVTYLEAHGTGTLLGDPIEIKAATEVYGRSATGRQYCAVASVKSNIGHLMQASGIASLIKLVLSLQRQIKPPTLHCRNPHPRFRFGESPFYPILSAEPWSTSGEPRRGAVSSFGFGGTNLHAILQEHPVAASGRAALPPTPFRRKRYWLGREIAPADPVRAVFDSERARLLLPGLKSGAVSRREVLNALNFRAR